MDRYVKGVKMNVGFIGAGNMGGALANAISNDSQINIYIYDANEEKGVTFAYSISAEFSKLDDLVSKSDFIFLGVKPQILPEVLKTIDGKVKSGAVLVSMAAGVSISKIESELKCTLPVIRIMPNTPVNVGEGMTAFCRNSAVTDEKKNEFVEIMAYTGSLDEVEEEKIDAFCALAGCGPAYVYMFIDALASAAESLGIDRERALVYASKMTRGATKMVLSYDDEPTVLRDKVCSPGGATIEGVKSLDSDGFTDTVKSAILAAYKRTLELGK